MLQFRPGAESAHVGNPPCALYAHTLFHFHLGQEGDHSVELSKEDGQVKKRIPRPFLEHFHLANLQLCRGAAAKACTLEVFAVAKAQQGVHVFWNLEALYNEVGGNAWMLWGRFRAKGWEAWMKHVKRAGLGQTMLLPATAVRSISQEVLAGLPRSPFAWAAAGTPAALLLLLRWVSPLAATGRCNALQPAAEELLNDFWRALPSVFTLRGD